MTSYEKDEWRIVAFLAAILLVLIAATCSAHAQGFTPPPFVPAPQGAIRITGVALFFPRASCEDQNNVQPCYPNWETVPGYAGADGTKFGRLGNEFLQLSVPITNDPRYRLICVESGHTLGYSADTLIIADGISRCYVERWWTIGTSAGHNAVLVPVERIFVKTTEQGAEPDLFVSAYWRFNDDPLGMPVDKSRVLIEPTYIIKFPTWRSEQ